MPPTRRPLVATALTLLALAGVVAGQVVWTANTLLRDEQRLSNAVHGVLVREPVRGEAAPALATDLADTAYQALRTGPGPDPRPRLRRELHAVAVSVVAGPAFDQQLEPVIRAMAAWFVSGRRETSEATNVLWDAYKAELAKTHPRVARRLEALPTPDDLRDLLATTPASPLPQRAPPQGLRHTLRTLPAVLAFCFLLAFAAAVGVAVAGGGSGRIATAVLLLPAAATLLAWAFSRGPGSWAFLLHTAARAALPACAVTAAIALAPVLIAGRRSQTLGAVVSPPAPDDPLWPR